MSKHNFFRSMLLIGTLLLAVVFGLTAIPVQAQILGTNWTGDFYNNTTLSGDPVATDVDYPTGICFNWGTNAPTAGSNLGCAQGNPITGIEADSFSAVFTSTQELAEAGVYVFTLRFNDGMRFYVDDELVYDNFTDHPDEGNLIYAEAQINHFLVAGSHEFKAEYVEFTGMAIIQIQWGLGSNGGATPTSNPENELLRNNGFEGLLVGDAVGETVPWFIPTTSLGLDAARCNNPETEKIVAHTGECAFRFTTNLDRDNLIRQFANLEDITFASGDSLTLSFWLNAKKPSTAGKVKVTVRYSDETEPTRFSLDLAQTEGYELIEENILLASTSVSKVRVQFKNTSPSGKIFLDDVSLLLITGSGSAILPLPLSPESALTGK